jgi:hypothetical protein
VIHNSYFVNLFGVEIRLCNIIPVDIILVLILRKLVSRLE